MDREEISAVVSAWQATLGKKGGLSRSDRKRAAARENAAKAREARAEKRSRGECK